MRRTCERVVVSLLLYKHDDRGRRYSPSLRTCPLARRLISSRAPAYPLFVYLIFQDVLRGPHAQEARAL